MAKLGKPVDLSKFASTRARQRVFTLGIELEGGWDKLPEGVNLTRDSSVRIVSEISQADRAEFQTFVNMRAMDQIMSKAQIKRYQELYQIIEYGRSPIQQGEIPSPVLSTKDEKGQLFWKNWIRRFYPSHVNDTCGLHVHMGFQTHFTYQRLMVPEYPATILAELARWANEEKLDPKHPMWPRLAGKSEYCQHTFYAQEQAQESKKDFDHHRTGNRYSVIAYRWTQFQSIECRLLPAFEDVEQSIRAIEELIRATNLFLVATRKREEKRPVEVKVDSPADIRFSYLEV
jgi:hypothetical protein